MNHVTVPRALVLVAGLLGAAWILAAYASIHVGPLPRLGGGQAGAGSGAVASFGPDGGQAVELALTLGDPATSGLGAWPGVVDAAPAFYDFNGDGALDAVVHSNDTDVYVFDGATGKAVARLGTTYPPGWYIERILNAPAVAVLEPGGAPTIVVANHAAYVTAWRYDAAKSTESSFAFSRAWEHRANACFKDAGMDAPAVLADADGDGTLEIFVQTEEVGLFAYRANGTVAWSKCWAGGNAAPTVEDLDGDGRPEAIFASDAGLLSVLDAATGRPIWSFDAAAQGVRPASIPVSPTVAELDGQPPKEVLFVARHAPEPDPDRFDEFHMAIFAVHQEPNSGKAAVVWMRQPDWAHPMSYTHLKVADVDGDGRADVFGMDWNTVGHQPGNWEPLGPAHVFRLNAEGQDVWVTKVDSWWSNKDIALADVDGDGAMDVVVNGANRGHDGLWRLDSRDGSPRGFLSIAPWKMMRGPVLLDLDGGLGIAVTVEPDTTPATRGAVLVYVVPQT